MKRLILLILAVVLWSQAASAQETLLSGAIKNRRDSTLIHIRGTTVCDTSITFNTSGWSKISLQHRLYNGLDSSQFYVVLTEWSNDQNSWTTFGDSVVVRSNTIVRFDSFPVRELTYMRFLFRPNVEYGESTGQLSTGYAFICAKGKDSSWF